MDEYNKAVDEFFSVYRRLKQLKDVAMVTHFSMYKDSYIKIYEWKDEQYGKRICYATDEDDITVYKIATRDVKRLIEKEKEKREKNSDICNRDDSVCVHDMVHMRDTSECAAAASRLHTAV